AGGDLADLLQRPRLEVIPLDGVEEAVTGNVPREFTVTITSSPTRGQEATLVLAERLAAQGYHVVPHLAARLIEGRVELENLIAQIESMGIREVFVVAGDIDQPLGPFDGAASLLRAMAQLGHGLKEI